MPTRLPPEECEECDGSGMRWDEDFPQLAVPCECEGS